MGLDSKPGHLLAYTEGLLIWEVALQGMGFSLTPPDTQDTDALKNKNKKLRSIK